MSAPRPPKNLLLDKRDLFGPERHHFRVHLDQFPGRHPKYRKHPEPATPLVSRLHSGLQRLWSPRLPHRRPRCRLASCVWSGPKLRDSAQRCGCRQNCAFSWWQVVFFPAGEVLCSLKPLHCQWPINYSSEEGSLLIKYLPAMCHALKEELCLFFVFIPHIKPVR